MPHINVTNLSEHDQGFEVHGSNNNNKNITLKAGQITSLPAADGTSGAIVVLQDGHEGGQAEITKDSFEDKLNLLFLVLFPLKKRKRGER